MFLKIAEGSAAAKLYAHLLLQGLCRLQCYLLREMEKADTLSDRQTNRQTHRQTYAQTDTHTDTSRQTPTLT